MCVRVRVYVCVCVSVRERVRVCVFYCDVMCITCLDFIYFVIFC